MRTSSNLFLVLLCAGAAFSCSSTVIHFGTGGDTTTGPGSSGTSSAGQGGANTGSSTSASGGNTTGSTSASGGNTASSSSGQMSSSTASSSSGQTSSTASSSSGQTSSTASSSSGSTTCVITNPNVDMDGDGWSPAQGDCNDCDPNVNPGAVDIPGDPGQVDHDCSGSYDPPQPCDTGLALDDVDADDAAKAIELCQVTNASAPLPQKIWGVLSSQYVRADGTALASPGLQVGIQSAFGPNVNPQGGQNMLALSSGAARTTSQPGACGSNSCDEDGLGTAPPGFPLAMPSCPPTTVINDDVGLQVDIRTPTNATGYAFSFKFYSMEFPYWVCQPYNDQFIALASPAPAGAMNGNISFDSMQNPVSTALTFFDVCDPTQISQYAAGCTGTCPTAPNPYCPSGTAQLQGTGFDVWDTSYGGAGATIWLSSQAPVVGGSELTLRFAIWDGGDQAFDSTVLVDDFQWITTPSVVVSTTAIAAPK